MNLITDIIDEYLKAERVVWFIISALFSASTIVVLGHFLGFMDPPVSTRDLGVYFFALCVMLIVVKGKYLMVNYVRGFLD